MFLLFPFAFTINIFDVDIDIDNDNTKGDVSVAILAKMCQSYDEYEYRCVYMYLR